MKRETVKRLQRERAWADAMITVCTHAFVSYVNKGDKRGYRKALDAIREWSMELGRIDQQLKEAEA